MSSSSSDMSPDEIDAMINQLIDLSGMNEGGVFSPLIDPNIQLSTLPERLRDYSFPHDDALHTVAKEKDPIAYELSMSAIDSFRLSGVVSQIEILSQGCCQVCEAYGPFFDITDDVIVPVPGCTREWGCNCAVSPILERPLGEP